METVYLIGGFVFGIAALVVAVASDLRTRRATRELARELVQLRERVQSLSSPTGHLQAPSGGETAAHELGKVVTPRIERLERRLRELTDGPPAPEAGARRPETVEARITGSLRRQGYTSVVVLELLAPNAVRVEAECDGMTVKGIARLGADGTVELSTVSSARAFP